MRPKYPVLLVAGLGVLFTIVNLASAQGWTRTSAPAQPWKALASSADGSKLVAAGYYHASVYADAQPIPIYTSSDAGMTWVQTTASNIWTSVASSADGSKLMAVSGGRIYTLQFPASPPPPVPSPRLAISPSGGSLGIFWLVPSTSFVLQQNSDLSSANWIDTPTAPTLNSTNLHYQVTVSPSLGSRFYRLKQQ